MLLNQMLQFEPGWPSPCASNDFISTLQNMVLPPMINNTMISNTTKQPRDAAKDGVLPQRQQHHVQELLPLRLHLFVQLFATSKK